MSYANLAVLDFPEWSPIARCVRGRGGFNHWQTLDDAPMNVDDARKLEEHGQIFMAHKKINDTWFVVVKSRRTPRPYVEAREPLGAGMAKRVYRKKWHAL